MARIKDSTLTMRENYISLHKQGLSPCQIAAQYDLPPAIVYDSLEAIAKAAGVPRDSLLQRPRSGNKPTASSASPTQDNSIASPFDAAQDNAAPLALFNQHFENAISILNQLMEDITTTIAEQEQNAHKFSKEAASWQ